MFNLMNARRQRTLVAVIGLVAGSGALACSSEDRSELAMMGYSTAQINAQCGSGGNPFVTPSMPIAQNCVTQYGACAMGTRVPVGNQCGCPARNGHWIPGVAR